METDRIKEEKRTRKVRQGDVNDISSLKNGRTWSLKTAAPQSVGAPAGSPVVSATPAHPPLLIGNNTPSMKATEEKGRAGSIISTPTTAVWKRLRGKVTTVDDVTSSLRAIVEAKKEGKGDAGLEIKSAVESKANSRHTQHQGMETYSSAPSQFPVDTLKNSEALKKAI